MRKIISTMSVAAIAVLLPFCGASQILPGLMLDSQTSIVSDSPHMFCGNIIDGSKSPVFHVCVEGGDEKDVAVGLKIYDFDFNEIKSLDFKTVVTHRYGIDGGASPIKVVDEDKDYGYVLVTQSLFNKTSDYEYVFPIIKEEKLDNTYDYWSYDIVGYEIISTDAGKLFEIRLPDGWSGTSMTVYTYSGKLKIFINARNESSNGFKTFVYSYDCIDSGDTGTNAMKHDVEMVQVYPKVLNGSEPLHVSFDRFDGLKTIEIFSVSGMLQYQQFVPAGVNDVEIGSGRLPKGVNIVRVAINGKEVENFKILVQ